MAVRTNYVLIDYENVQPADLALLRKGPFKVKVFLGAHQAKIPVALAAALQGLGSNAEYVCLQSSGSNAVDFHIAYYIGILSAQDAFAFFHIISEDTGFDPLIQHLKDKGVLAHRSPSIASIPYFKVVNAPIDSQLQAAIAHLTKLKGAKPRTKKTLVSTLHTLFKNELSELQITAMIASLRSQGILKVEGANIAYALPNGAETCMERPKANNAKADRQLLKA